MIRSKANVSFRARGFSLVEVLIAISLLAFVAISNLYVFNLMNHLRSSSFIKSRLVTDQQNFVVYLSDGKAWQKTVDAPDNEAGGFSCFNSGDCDHGGPFKLALDQNGTNFYDGTNAHSGVSPSGEFCTDFPSSECPYHWQLSWKAVCTTCSPKLIQVNMVATLSSALQKRALASIDADTFGISSIESFNPTYGYSPWGAFSACAGGEQTRTRQCEKISTGEIVSCSLCGGNCTNVQTCTNPSGRWYLVSNHIALFPIIGPTCPVGLTVGGAPVGHSCTPLGAWCTNYVWTGTRYHSWLFRCE